MTLMLQITFHLLESWHAAHDELQVGPQFREQAFAAAFASSPGRWHFLYFLPLPHQHGSFLPGLAAGGVI
jgi:hypothetical protein